MFDSEDIVREPTKFEAEDTPSESDRRAAERRELDRRGRDRRAQPHEYGSAAQFWDTLVEEYKDEQRQEERRAQERRQMERRRREQRTIDATLGSQKPGEIDRRR